MLFEFDQHDDEMNNRVALLLWRTWFVRNELVHNGKWLPTNASVAFLLNYEDLLGTKTQMEGKGGGKVKV